MDPEETTLDQGQNEVVETTEEVQSQKPPYAEYLEGLPESIVPQVEKAFKEWDSRTTQKFQEVHSQYEPLKPWKEFVDNNVDPEQAVQGLILLQRLQQDPQAVYEQIAQAFGLGQQGQQEPLEQDSFGEPEDITKHPQFTQMQNMTQAMAEYLVQQDTEQKQRAADAAVDAELNSLKQKFGDFDERFVVTQMLAGMSGEQAVQAFNQAVQSAAAKQRAGNAPKILGAGGGIPSSTVDVGKMSKKDTLSLVQQMLAQGAQEG